MNLTKEQYLQECLKLLDYFHKDYSGDTILCHSGDFSVICNPESEFYDVFGGYSLWGVCKFVAEELNKKVEFRDDDY